MKTNRPAFRIGCLILAATVMNVAPSYRPDAGARRRKRVGLGDLQRGGHAAVAARQRARGRRRACWKSAPRGCRTRSGWCWTSAAARLAVQKTVIPGVAAPVRGVRVGQFRPDVARVVVDLTSAAPYQILREGPAVVVSFDRTARVSGGCIGDHHHGCDRANLRTRARVPLRHDRAPAGSAGARHPRPFCRLLLASRCLAN